jgi:hypothetical protein
MISSAAITADITVRLMLMGSGNFIFTVIFNDKPMGKTD